MRPDMLSFAVVLTMFYGSAVSVTAQVLDRTVQPLVTPPGLGAQDAARLAEGLLKAYGPVAEPILGTFAGHLGSTLANFGDNTKVGALTDAATALNEVMAGFTPNYSPNGMPRIPVSCGYVDDEWALDPNASCASCFSQAIRTIDATREDFERLRAVGSRTKTYVDAALAFGDSFSTVAGNGSLGWTKSRPEVEASWVAFKQRYDTSYRSLLTKLDIGLRALDTCEANYFDNHDWYNRQGFMFFAFMEARYELE